MLSFRIVRSFSSKFKSGGNISFPRANALKDVLENNNVADIKWENVRDKLMTDNNRITKVNLDRLVLNQCFQEQRLDLAKSYIKFLESQSIHLNDALIGQFLRIHYRDYRNWKNGQEKLSAQDEDEIIKYGEYLIAKYEILDSDLAEGLIFGLSMTRDWMKCIDLLKHIEFFNKKPTGSIYSCIISKALDEDRFDIMWNLLDLMVDKNLAPRTLVFLKFFSKFKDNNEALEKMLQIMSENGLLLPENQINEFKDVFKGRKSEILSLDKKGHCSACFGQLKKAGLNEDEFKKLSKTFLEDVIVKSDVYLKTNPQELRNFMKFVDNSPPFDCVIDGLNVAFASTAASFSIIAKAKNVEQVVKYFVERGKSCLVIGRKHMINWRNPSMNYIRRNSSLFLAENISQDDPFMLYAALRNGPDTKIVSNDLMRSHSYLLDSESMKLFRRWQLQNQYSLKRSRNVTTVEEPVAYDLKAQKIGSYWHIPFTSENLNFSHETFEHPSRWMCLKIDQDNPENV